VPTSSDSSSTDLEVRLIWRGKADDPLASLHDRPAPRLTLGERYLRPGGAGSSSGGWRDLLVHGDNVAFLQVLLSPPWRDRIAAAGGLRLVYLDPPFLTGGSLQADVQIGETTGPDGRPRLLRLPAFQDHGPRQLPVYLDEMRLRLNLIRELLADDGSLYLHCDHRLSPYLRLLLDEVFGPDRFVNELAWHYGLGNPGNGRAFARKHDTILLYAKTDRYRFNRLRGEVTRAMANKYRHEDAEGRYMLAYGRKYRLKGGKPLDSVWEIPSVAATDGDRWGYPTQKPVALLERIVSASSDPGDLVADLCCGAGTLAVAATRLGRRWLIADRGLLAVHVARRRLLSAGEAAAAEGRGWPGFDVGSCGRDDDGALDAVTPLDALGVVGFRVDLRTDEDRWLACLQDVTVDGVDAVALEGSLNAGQRRLAVAGGRLVEVAADRAGQRTRTVLTETAAEWLDGWALGRELVSDDGDRIVQAEWWSVRAPRSRRLDLSAHGSLAADAPSMALGFDFFGGAVRSVVSPVGQAW
jgi:hypothetical protein